jgi:hypothetical protein
MSATTEVHAAAATLLAKLDEGTGLGVDADPSFAITNGNEEEALSAATAAVAELEQQLATEDVQIAKLERDAEQAAESLEEVSQERADLESRLQHHQRVEARQQGVCFPKISYLVSCVPTPTSVSIALCFPPATGPVRCHVDRLSTLLTPPSPYPLHPPLHPRPLIPQRAQSSYSCS